MAFIRNRITRSLSTLSTSIRASKGNIFIGRFTSGGGLTEEIELGDTLAVVGGVLNVVPAEVVTLNDVIEAIEENPALVNEALGANPHATLEAANAAEGEIGKPFYDTTLETQRTTTDIT